MEDLILCKTFALFIMVTRPMPTSFGSQIKKQPLRRMGEAQLYPSVTSIDTQPVGRVRRSRNPTIPRRQAVGCPHAGLRSQFVGWVEQRDTHRVRQ